MDPVNLVTACQRIAKLHHGSDWVADRDERIQMAMLENGEEPKKSVVNGWGMAVSYR